jgi:hypothetical protein
LTQHCDVLLQINREPAAAGAALMQCNLAMPCYSTATYSTMPVIHQLRHHLAASA